MLNLKNMVRIEGGIVADPDKVSDNIVKFRIGVDWSASDRVSDNTSGYFNVTYFLNNEGSNANWVKSQLEAGNLSKGSQVAILGRLVQERWKNQEDQNRDNVVIYAEEIAYAGSRARTEGAATSASSGSSTEGFEAPEEF